jgi:hypothetical protein
MGIGRYVVDSSCIVDNVRRRLADARRVRLRLTVKRLSAYGWVSIGWQAAAEWYALGLLAMG